MKEKNKLKKIVICLMCIFLLSGCTKQLKGKDNKVITSVKNIKKNDIIDVELSDGCIKAEVK